MANGTPAFDLPSLFAAAAQQQQQEPSLAEQLLGALGEAPAPVQAERLGPLATLIGALGTGLQGKGAALGGPAPVDFLGRERGLRERRAERETQRQRQDFQQRGNIATQALLTERGEKLEGERFERGQRAAREAEGRRITREDELLRRQRDEKLTDAERETIERLEEYASNIGANVRAGASRREILDAITKISDEERRKLDPRIAEARGERLIQARNIAKAATAGTILGDKAQGIPSLEEQLKAGVSKEDIMLRFDADLPSDLPEEEAIIERGKILARIEALTTGGDVTRGVRGRGEGLLTPLGEDLFRTTVNIGPEVLAVQPGLQPFAIAAALGRMLGRKVSQEDVQKFMEELSGAAAEANTGTLTDQLTRGGNVLRGE